MQNSLDACDQLIELCELLRFQPRFRLPLHWMLTRLEKRCVEVQSDSRVRSYRLRRRHGNPISNVCAPSRSILTPGTRRPDLVGPCRKALWIVATGEKSGDQNLLGPQGVPLWSTIFTRHLTYAVNNWVGAAAAADRLSSRPTLRVLEIGAAQAARRRFC